MPGRHVGIRLHRFSSAAKRSANASRASWHVAAPPGGCWQPDLAVLTGRQQDGGVARRRRLAPLVLSPEVEVDRRTIVV